MLFRTLVLSFAFVGLLGTAAWGDAPPMRLLVFADNMQPTTPTNSNLGFAAGAFDIDVENNTATYSLAIGNLMGTENMTVIHGPADPGQGGSAQFTFPNGLLKNGVWNYPESLEADLLAGRMYIDVHTSAFPDGELRGQITDIIATLDGDQEVGSVMTSGQGYGIFTIDTDANTLGYTIGVEGLVSSEIIAQIHGPATHGETGVALHDLPTGSTKVGVWNYPESLEAAILQGRTYVNVHTDSFPAGEIRGQIVGSLSVLCGDQEVPPVTTAARGYILASADPESGTLGYDWAYIDLSAPESDAHIHGPALPGVNGSVAFAVAPGTRKLGNATVSSQFMNDYFSCLAYANVHSDNFLQGEIRGQVIPSGPFLIPFVRGDVNSDGTYSGLVDALFFLSFGFSGGAVPTCMAALDANGDGSADALLDTLYILNNSFSGGLSLPAPHPDCGLDPNPSGLGCDLSGC